MDFLNRIRNRAERRRAGTYLGGVVGKKGLFSQHDMDLANQAGAAYRGDNNQALVALVTLSSGSSAPSTTFAYQLWADTTNTVLKQRNAANTGWIIRGSLKESFIINKSSGFTVGVADFMQVYNCTGSFTISLTAAATLGDGFVFQVRNEGSGYITIDPNGSELIDGATTIILGPGGTAVIWCNGSAFKTLGRTAGRQSVWVPASAMVARTTNGGASATRELTTNKQMIRSMNFADGATKLYAQFLVAMPYGWDLGAVRAVPHWTFSSGSGVVLWGIAGLAVSDDDAMDAAFGTEVTVTDTALTANDEHRAAETGDVTIGGTPIANDLVYFQVSRDPAHGSDTFSGTAELLGVMLHINVKTMDDTQ
jgi:hypothetical protein